MRKGSTLGIVGCPVLEDELVYLLSIDGEISHKYVIANGECEGFIRKFRKSAPDKEITLIEENRLPSLRAGTGLTVIVCMMSIGLHEYPDELRSEVLSTVGKMESKCDAILLFYGLCGNAFKNLDKISREIGCPLVILTDEKDRIVDDCIAVPLGGTDQYLALLKRYPGVFYMTPGWAENWETLLSKMELFRGTDGSDVETMKFIFDMAGYSKVLKIPTGLGDEETLDRKTSEFARIFGFEEHCLEREWCSLKVIEHSYKKVKSLLGNGHGGLSDGSGKIEALENECPS